MKHTHQKGNVLILTTVFFVVISLSVCLGLVVPAIRTHKIAEHTLHSKRSYYLSQSGVDDVMYRLKAGLNVAASQTLVLNNAEAITEVFDMSGNQKQIVSSGDSNDRVRKIEAILSSGEGVSFSYGIQSGKGGVTMGNNSEVLGSIYSNGPVTGSGSVTGSVTSANSATLVADQENGTGAPAYNLTFGTVNATQDIAQSFQISQEEQLNKVRLYIKKVGNPSGLNVSIVADNAGNPTGTTLGTGSLSSSLVSTNYGWVDVSFSSNPNLYTGTSYWVVLDGGSSTSNYYIVGANTSYVLGSAKIGRVGSTWAATTPTNADLYFSVYTGGITGKISGISVGEGGLPPANAAAHTVENSTITGINYCQTGSGNNKPCNTSTPPPPSIEMPISEQNILDWKASAEDGGVHSGNYTVNDSNSSLGPKKITGNLRVENNAELTVFGTLWVQGDFVVDNNADIRLAPNYGGASGMIIVDGTVTISNNSMFYGSGDTGTYIMVLSTSYSESAITIENNVGAVILYAANGTVNISNNASAVSINGFKINLSNNAVVDYDTGLANANFVNGPGGTWNVRSIKEIE